MVGGGPSLFYERGCEELLRVEREVTAGLRNQLEEEKQKYKNLMVSSGRMAPGAGAIYGLGDNPSYVRDADRPGYITSKLNSVFAAADAAAAADGEG